MNDIERHGRVQQLLPWYATGALRGRDLVLVREHLAECTACRAALHAEHAMIAAFEQTAPAAPSPEPGLQRLMASIAPAPRPAVAVSKPAAPSRWREWLAAVFASPAWQPALAGAAAMVIVTVLMAPSFNTPATNPDTSFRVLGTQPASARASAGDLHLVLAPDVDAARRDALVAGIGGRIVEGPNSVGAYTVRISAGTPSDLRNVLEALRGEPGVLLAEAAAPLAMPHIGPEDEQ